MKVEILNRHKSFGVHELNELPTRERETIILPDGVFTFVGIGRNCNTGMTEIYVCNQHYYDYMDEWHVAKNIPRVSPSVQVSS